MGLGEQKSGPGHAEIGVPVHTPPQGPALKNKGDLEVNQLSKMDGPEDSKSGKWIKMTKDF